MNKHIEVVAAIIIYDGKILCLQRGQSKYEYISKKFEFPGGKTEPGESKEDAIRREILEELNMLIEVDKAFLSVTHHYPDFIVTLHGFICTCKNTKITLTEHIDFKWLNKNELINLDWAAADLPMVSELIKLNL